MPTVSIVIPCYNGAEFVTRTIDSIQEQTLREWEIIVVDDGSTDDTAEVIGRYCAANQRIRLLGQPNGYLSNARNNGYKLCSPDSRYVIFLDADDLLAPHALETMTTYLDRHSDAGLAYCTLQCIDSNDVLLPTDDYPWLAPRRFVPMHFDCIGVRELPFESGETPLPALMAHHVALPSCCLYRRTAFEKAGLWDEDFSKSRVICEDKDMALRVALHAAVHFVAEYLMLYRRHANNASSNQDKGIQGQKLLEKKWRVRLATLPKEQAARVRKAFVFDKYVAATQMKEAMVDAIKARDFRRALSLSVQSAKKAAVFLVRGGQWLYGRALMNDD